MTARYHGNQALNKSQDELNPDVPRLGLLTIRQTLQGHDNDGMRLM